MSSSSCRNEILGGSSSLWPRASNAASCEEEMLAKAGVQLCCGSLPARARKARSVRCERNKAPQLPTKDSSRLWRSTRLTSMQHISSFLVWPGSIGCCCSSPACCSVL
jgi:hypothetical protein